MIEQNKTGSRTELNQVANDLHVLMLKAESLGFKLVRMGSFLDLGDPGAGVKTPLWHMIDDWEWEEARDGQS